MRIRTIKPFIWRDEKVRALSRDARLLFVALITLADDAGRFDALPSIILGHAYPTDRDATRKIDVWISELVNAGIVRVYGPDGEYGQILNWEKHQRVQHPSPSLIPEPVGNGSHATHETLRNRS